MNNIVLKKLTEINVQEWIVYYWDFFKNEDDIPVYARLDFRDPSEAKEAEENFTIWLNAYRAIEAKK